MFRGSTTPGGVNRAGLPLAGEPLPRGLAGDLEGGADARPGHPSLAQDGDQPLEVRLSLRADRGDAGKQVQDLSVSHGFIPGRQLRPRLGRLLLLGPKDVAAQPDAPLQMYTPGPAITFPTSELGLAQKEQRTWIAVVAAGVSLVMLPPGESYLSG